jgi:predicted Zn-dependent peptidase
MDAGWRLDLAAAPAPRRAQTAAEIPTGRKLQVINRPIQQANVLVGCQGLIGQDDRRYAMAILNTVLGGGMSSRLFQEIREKRGLAYSVYSFNQGYSDGAYFGLYAGCSPAKTTEVTRLMLEEFTKLANAGITADELELAKGNINGGMALKFESTQARMSRLVGTELINGEFYDLDATIEQFNAVTAEDVRALAADLLTRSRSIVAVGDIGEAHFDEFL